MSSTSEEKENDDDFFEWNNWQFLVILGIAVLVLIFISLTIFLVIRRRSVQTEQSLPGNFSQARITMSEYPEVNFQTCVKQNGTYRPLFEQYLLRSKSQESLIFFDDMEKFEQEMDNGCSLIDMQFMAIDIYQKYIVLGAPCQLNLDHDVCEELRCYLANTPVQEFDGGILKRIFQPIKDSVEQLLTEDPLINFRTSPEFQRGISRSVTV